MKGNSKDLKSGYTIFFSVFSLEFLEKICYINNIEYILENNVKMKRHILVLL